MTAALEEWPAFSSKDLLWHGGLEEFARRSYNAAAAAESLPDVLLSHLPPDPRKLARGKTGPISIKELVQRHRGEVRELSSTARWSPRRGKLPATARHQQLEGLLTQKQPGDKYHMRVAKVFSLMDLFSAHGSKFSAAELYEVYKSCPP